MPSAPDRAISLSAEREDVIIAAIRAGTPTRSALRLAGVSTSQFYEWLRIAADDGASWHTGSPVSEPVRAACKALYERVLTAQAELEQEMVQALRDAATTAEKRDWRAAESILRRHEAFRTNWHEAKQVDVSVTAAVSHEHRLAARARELTDVELLEALPAEWRELVSPPALPSAPDPD